jgi:hypothetical protein
VASYWITAIASIAGAVVGASATLSANWLTARSQFRTQMMLAADEHEKQVADVRAAACSKYLTAADIFYEDVRKLVSRMEARVVPAELKDDHYAHSAGWKHLQRVIAPVVIAGPSDLARRADTHMSKLAELSQACDDWYLAYVRNPSTPGRGTKFWSLRVAADEARADFIVEARTNTYPEKKPAVSALPPERRLGAIRVLAGLPTRLLHRSGSGSSASAADAVHQAGVGTSASAPAAVPASAGTPDA